MDRLLTALSRAIGVRRAWKGRHITALTADTPWGFVRDTAENVAGPDGEPGAASAAGPRSAARHRGDGDAWATTDRVEIDAAMMKYAGQTTRSFEEWAVEAYRFLARQFCTPGVDFVKIDLTAPPLSRALTEHARAVAAAGRTPVLSVGEMGGRVVSLALEEGVADVETKVFGVWTPRELSYHLRAGSDGPEAAMTSTRYELEKLVVEVEFAGFESYAAPLLSAPAGAATDSARHADASATGGDGDGRGDAAAAASAVKRGSVDPSPSDSVRALQDELAELRKRMKQGTLPASERPRIAELGKIIRTASAASSGDGVVATDAAGSSDGAAGGDGGGGLVAVTHRWVFEADTPRLSKGEMPVWRATNINHALDIPTGRRRQPEITRQQQ